MLLIEIKGGLYQRQLYYTNIVLEKTITLLHYTYTNTLRDLFLHACILDELKPFKEDQKLSILDSI